ncbi:MAG: hypothetical protein H0W14_02145 [Actinobacteria bacterium]|nr:hypothetical protein [Actinomycetota bacterium]
MQAEARAPVPEWVVPLLVAAVAIPTFVAFWIGGRPELGAVWAGVSVAFGMALALGGRNDTIRMLRGSEDDERTLLLEYRATAAMGVVLVAALVGLFLAAGIRGENGLVYGLLLLGGGGGSPGRARHPQPEGLIPPPC